MKRSLLSMISVLMVVFAVNAQTVLFEEDFESYTVGGFLAQQATSGWTTWSNAPGGTEDALISSTQANSPTKSLHIANSQDDIVLKLGNKTSGIYSVKFHYYIPTGNGGYFNIQHFESPGIEWAVEVYFGNNGNGQITVNSVNENFAHINDAWIEIETIVDLDQDSAWLTIDGSPIKAWQFSMQSNAPTGTKQLGGINFYGGALPGQTPNYFVDDVVFTQIQAGTNPPDIELSTTSIATDGASNEVFTISNMGDDQMTFIAYPIYPSSGTKSGSTETTQIGLVSDKNNKANELSYVSGALASGLGFGSTVTVRSAVKFDYTFMNQYIGRELVSITVGINELPSGTTKVLVYDRGSYSTPGAGSLLAEKVFTATTIATEIVVTLDNPVYIDGKDIWIGWTCDAIGGTYPIGLDEGPRVTGVNWLSTGPGWSELNLSINNNLYIMGTLQGSSLYQWLSVSPQTGVVNGGGSQPITASFNITGMAPGNYFAQISVGCNDQTQEYTEIDVDLTIINSINENNEHVAVMTFPNPVTDVFNINANAPLVTVDVYSISGAHVRTFAPGADNFSFSVDGLESGVYTVVISTGSDRIERKIVVE